MSEGHNPPRWVRPSEALQILGVSSHTLRRWAEAGHLRTHRTPGNQRRYLHADLARIAEHGIQANKEGGAA